MELFPSHSSPAEVIWPTMTRREIILRILAEASGRTLEEAGDLLEAMIREEMVGGTDLEEDFPQERAQDLLTQFREELPGIRRWLLEAGLLGEHGQA